MAAPATVAPAAGTDERERLRRGQLASMLLLALLLCLLLALPVLLLSSAVIPGLVVGAVCLAVALPLNRAGLVWQAGALLVVALDVALAGTVLTASTGLDPIYLPVYYLFVIPELVAATVLPASAVFGVAALQSAFIFADVRYQPHNTMWEQMIHSDGILFSTAIAPVALQVIVAVVAYLWVRSAQEALRRADRAEDVAAMEQRELVRQRDLEEGVQHLLAVHVALANGDFSVRAPRLNNPLLWQVSASLNNLVSRLQRFAQALSQSQFMLRRTQEEAHSLAEAITAQRLGRPALLPAPSGTPLDPVIDALRGGTRWRGQQSGELPPSPPTMAPGPARMPPTSAPLAPNSAPLAPNSAPLAPNSAPLAPNSAPLAPNSAPLPPDPYQGLPEWLRPQ